MYVFIWAVETIFGFYIIDFTCILKWKVPNWQTDQMTDRLCWLLALTLFICECVNCASKAKDVGTGTSLPKGVCVWESVCVHNTYVFMCTHTLIHSGASVDDDEQAQWHEQAVRGSSNNMKNIKQQWRLQRQVCTLFCNLASHTSTWTCVHVWLSFASSLLIFFATQGEQTRRSSAKTTANHWHRKKATTKSKNN